MNFRLTVFSVFTLMAIVVPDTLYCADKYSPIDSPMLTYFLEPLEDDQSIYNDCNYCHGMHNARRDVSAVLNDKAERYTRYLGGTMLSSAVDQSVFAEESSRKCPRSRAKNKR